MTFAIALDLLLKYGPNAVLLGEKLVAAVKAGKAHSEITDTDWADLVRLANQKGEDIYARLGIAPPPA